MVIYYNEDQYASLDDVKKAIPDCWQMPELGSYIDEDGTIFTVPPFNVALTVKPLSELLMERVEGYE